MSTAVALESVRIRLERVPCPRCSSLKSSMIYSAQDYLYQLPGIFYAESCDDCGLWFQNPRPIETDLQLLYPDTYAPHLETTSNSFKQNSAGLRRKLTGPLRRLNWLKNGWRGWHNGYLTRRLGYQHRTDQSLPARFGAAISSSVSRSARWRAGCDLIPRFVSGGRLLELGCGKGDSLKRFRDLGWQDLHGVELSDSAARIARQSGFNVKTATIESALETYPDGWFDAIVAEMVLEHLVNPFKVVRQIARKLRPGGEFLFSTVIRDSIDGRIFGRYGVCFDFPRHMVFFRKRDLNEMLLSDFDQIHSWHQSTPIDFQRPASLGNSRFAPQLRSFFNSRSGIQVVQLLARLKLMGRVSYRCRRKQLQK